MKDKNGIFGLIMLIIISIIAFNIGYDFAKDKLIKSKKEEVQNSPFDFSNFGAHYIEENVNCNFVDSFQIGSSIYHINAFERYVNEKRTYKISYLIDIEYDMMEELVKDFESDSLIIALEEKTIMGENHTNVKIIDVKYLELLSRDIANKLEHKKMKQYKELHKKVFNFYFDN